MKSQLSIVVAPDKFKGSLSAAEAASAVTAGFRRVLDSASFEQIPLADGGDGTMQALVAATKGRTISRRATGPTGAPVDASFGMLDDRPEAVVELAQTSGLALVTSGTNDPRTSTTFGTGELIGAALDAGARRVIVAIGGSATNDAGAGALQALGVEFLDDTGTPVGLGGAQLARVAKINTESLRRRLRGVTIEIATDVRNPLCGSNGASAIYGPQKGASPAVVCELDAALAHLADVVAAKIGTDLRDEPGTGAAGGFGFGFLTLAGATLRDGAALVLSATRFEERIKDAALVITGEGKLDKQTASGKTPAAVAQAARKRGIPVVAVAGALDCTPDELEAIGIEDAQAAQPKSMDTAEAMRRAPELVTAAAETLAKRWRDRLRP